MGFYGGVSCGGYGCGWVHLFVSVLIDFVLFMEVSQFTLDFVLKSLCSVLSVKCYVFKLFLRFLNQFFSLNADEALTFVEGRYGEVVFIFFQVNQLYSFL